MASAVGNLSALAGSNISVELSSCSTPQIMCGWVVTFADFLGDIELLVADADRLEGNAAGVLVMEEVQGQDAKDVNGSPVIVRIFVALPKPTSMPTDENRTPAPWMLE